MADTIDHSNPLDSTQPLAPGAADAATKAAHPQTEILPGDSSTTRAEKVERRNGLDNGEEVSQRSPKRIKLDGGQESATVDTHVDSRKKGIAQIKAEYLIPHIPGRPQAPVVEHDDDAAEAGGKLEHNNGTDNKKSKRQKGERGQNKGRTFGRSADELRLCASRATYNEFSPRTCQWEGKCRFEHNLRKYIAEGKREDLDTFQGQCPVYAIKGYCTAGWKCRFVGSHSEEKTHEDGRKELVLVTKEELPENWAAENEDEDAKGVVNMVSMDAKLALRKKTTKTPKADQYTDWLEERQKRIDKAWAAADGQPSREDLRADYVESPLKPSEKRRIYYGPETPILAPLTTQGNLPFRRLCVSLGAQVTWSEMAMGLPLLQGEKGEWALLKAHETEYLPPKYSPTSILPGYDNSKDVKFGAQIAGNKPWLAAKTTEVLANLCPGLRAIDLNCGCPIELVFRQGAGSALMDNPGRMEKILRGMNLVSNDIPITVKIRMGTKDNHPTADKLVQRLMLGGSEVQELGEPPAGVAAIALHGRSRQQRYTRSADWGYIAETASLIERLRSAEDEQTDTVREADSRNKSANPVYFVGNGDCYSHEDYYSHLKDAKVDAVMVARGALVKPWIFEEIEAGQYLDKSSKQRLEYVEMYAKFGLEYWGSDEVGVGITRRFLLEWLSFSCRYVPTGILEHLPPRLGDRPPPYKGRDDLETLMCSPNYKDWIKLSEMFLGPAHKDFQFQPKHKSNSFETEAEG